MDNERICSNSVNYFDFSFGEEWKTAICLILFESILYYPWLLNYFIYTGKFYKILMVKGIGIISHK